MCFKQVGVISTLNGQLLKLVEQFSYFSSNISSTESDVSIHVGKAWTIIDTLSIIWKSDLSYKMGIFPSCSCVSTIVYLHHLDSNEKARWELHKNAVYYFEQILEAAPNKTAALRPLASYLINHSSMMNIICWALLETKVKLISNVLLWIPILGHTSIGPLVKTYINQLCVDTEGPTKSDGW